MSAGAQRNGELNTGFLSGLHASGCPGSQTYSSCRPVFTGHPECPFAVVYMAWCGDCGAVRWEVVDGQ